MDKVTSTSRPRLAIELTSDAVAVAKAFMDLNGDDRREFKRAIEVHSWLANRFTPGDFKLGPIRVHVVSARDE